MAKVISARMTHDYEGELVVYLIGMRINKLWRPDLWLPTFLAMGLMLTELSKDKDSGLLGYRLTIGAGGPLVVQYWNSHEKLYRYAGDRNAAHRPAWAAFNRVARKAPGAVGVWHETYVVERAESIYSGMPVSGLAGATSAVPVARRGETTRDRPGVEHRIEGGSWAA